MLQCCNLVISQGTASKQKNPYSLAEKDVQWIREATIQQLNGQPNLNTEQFRRMMNIVSVEGIIQGVIKIKKKYSNSSEYYKYDVYI